jgi:molybdate transport system ATP-binding protein
MSLSLDCQFVHSDGFELSVRLESSSRLTVVTGPSGSGKSTLLMLLAGLLKGRSQRIVLNETVLAEVASGTHLPPNRRGLGVAFQEARLFPHLNGRQNLIYADWRKSPNGIDSPAEIARRLEIDTMLNKPVHQLSGGQQQRLALGRAMLAARSMLVLDEPLTSVEPQLRTRIAELIDDFSCETGLPVLAVTHNEALVEGWKAERIELAKGRVAVAGAKGNS